MPEPGITPEEYDDELCALACGLIAGLAGSVALNCEVLYGKDATLEMMFIKLRGWLSWRQMWYKILTVHRYYLKLHCHSHS